MVSVFLGDELTAILEAIETDTAYSGVEKKKLKLGADVLPRFFRDTTDRNRTSPFAFTGNKFEFRMLGSSNSIACAQHHAEYRRGRSPCGCLQMSWRGTADLRSAACTI